ncbi:hypothetical protein [Pseudomonas vranovensis]|uniref:hypothetical protein n=1 Tax=Pseudomonas vranovensis TaxID=321661 RepID=UPI003D98E217
MAIERYIQDGLKYAEADYVSIAKRGRFDVKPKEDQLKCALYRSFCEGGFLVHVEAGYARKAGRCDLFAASSSSTSSVAIEIKTAWAGNGWINKPAEQQRSWEMDINKLRALEGGDWANAGYFILCFAYEKGSLPEVKLRKSVSALGGVLSAPFVLDDWNGLNEAQFCVVKVFAP